MTQTFAESRDFLQAQKIAQQKAAALGASISERNIQQARVKGRGTDTSQQTTPYYIFNFDGGTGYAIVGGDDRMPAIVGYSDKGTFNPDSLPVNLKSFLAAYKATVEAVEKGDSVAVKNVKAAMSRAAGSYTPVEPLLGEKPWGQGIPFNNLCPEYNDEGRSRTGCVATAMAQIMSYWKFPITLQEDIPGYFWRGEQINTIPKGFAYDWDNMIDSPSIQDTAVASLMLHAGVSVHSMYTATSGTDGFANEVPYALTTYFGYDKQTITELYRWDFEWDDWNCVLQKELALKRPIFYSGGTEETGHAFVCDGIDADGYYHINWGWYGDLNGYFDITVLNPKMDKSHAGEYMQEGFVKSNYIIIGIQPTDGQAHEPAFSYDKLKIYGCYLLLDNQYRESQTDVFSGRVGFSFCEKNEKLPKMLCALGMKDEDGKIVCISTERQWVDVNPLTETPGQKEISFEYAFPKGVHEIFIIQSTDGGDTWQVCYGRYRQMELYASDHELFDKNTRYEEVETEGIKASVDKLEECASIVANNYSGNVVVPEYVTCAGKEYPVTTIGKYCFYYSSVTNVTLPKSIKSLKGGCFAGCNQLDSITIPKNVVDLGIELDGETYSIEGCFQKCTNLKKVIFEEGSQLKIIGGYSFCQCKSLQSVQIPEGVEIIRGAAFSNCFSLASVSLPSSVRELGRHCFAYNDSLTTIVIPEGVSKIGDYCFSDCSSLSNISLPSSVRKIGSGCFYYCSKLPGIKIPEGVAEIPDYCFEGCSSLTKISIPSTVRKLGAHCFYNLEKLEEVVLPEGLTEIGDDCFFFCHLLTKMNIPSTIRKFGNSCFHGCNSWKGSVVIPEGVTELPDWCFCDCRSIEKIEFPSTLRKIGMGCFFSCTGLSEIIFPKSLQELGDYCFSSCTGLSEITLPESLQELGDNCFSGCIGLKKVVVSEGLTTLPRMFFQYCVNVKEFILPSTIEAIGDSCFFQCIPNSIYLGAKSVPLNFSSSFVYEDYYSVKALKEQTVLYVPEESLDDYKRECGDMFKDILPLATTGVDDVLLEGVKISASGGTLEITGLQDGAKVRLYSLDGKYVGENTASNGTVSFSTTEPIVVAKIGDKAVKILTR